MPDGAAVSLDLGRLTAIGSSVVAFSGWGVIKGGALNGICHTVSQKPFFFQLIFFLRLIKTLLSNPNVLKKDKRSVESQGTEV